MTNISIDKQIYEMAEDCVDQIYSNESALNELREFAGDLTLLIDNDLDELGKQIFDDFMDLVKKGLSDDDKKNFFVEDEFKKYKQIFEESMSEFIDDIINGNFSENGHYFIERTYEFFVNILIFYLYYSLNSIQIPNPSDCEISRFDYSTDDISYKLDYYINFDEDYMKNLKEKYCEVMDCYEIYDI